MFCQLGTEMPDGKRARVVLPTGVCVAPNRGPKREAKGGTGTAGLPASGADETAEFVAALPQAARARQRGRHGSARL